MDRNEPRPATPPSTQLPAKCPTCGQRHPQPRLDGWGERIDWWDTWLCLVCVQQLCNMPVSLGGGATLPCYIKHMTAQHPELYAAKR